MKIMKRIIIGSILLLGIIAIVYTLWIEYCVEKSNPENYATIGDSRWDRCLGYV